MRSAALLVAMVCLLTAWSAAAPVLVDDFESYETGDVVTVASSVWTAVGSTTYTDIAESYGNQFINFGDTSGYFGAYRTIPTAITDADTATVFVRFYAVADAVDHSFGLSDESAPTWFSGLEVQCALLDDSTAGTVYLKARNSGTTTTVATVNVGQWYNLWMVVNQATDKYDVYLTSDSDSATSSNIVASQFGFRNGTTSDIVAFLVFAGMKASNVRIDDIYMSSGTNLVNPLKLKAHTPAPAANATDVAQEAMLSWSTGVDADDPATVNAEITKHYVYLNTEPNLVGKMVATVTASGTGGSYTPASSLAIDGTYYWRVDESVNDSSPTDGNTITGPVWYFEVIKSVPVITIQPSDTVTTAGATAEISLTATCSNGTMNYAWYKSTDETISEDDTAVGSDSSVLSFVVAAADEGYYYCKVVKSDNQDNPVYSNVVKLGVGRKLAHWTLDAVNYSDGQYWDTNTEDTVTHNATVTGAPTFVAGADKDATAGAAVTIDTANGYATAGEWNPSGFTGQFTVSLWAKWAGQGTTTTWQGLISKETSYGDGTMMWQYEITSDSASTVVLKNGLETNNLSTDALPIDTWEHVAIVWDGTTATIYRNGISAASGSWTPGTQTEAPVNIGISAFSETENLMFNGALDDIQIFNYAKTQNEVMDIYHAMTGKSVCVNKPEYDFDDDCLVTISDLAMFVDAWLNDGLYTNP